MAKGYTNKPKNCKWCGEPLNLPRQTKAKYHGDKCSDLAHKEKTRIWREKNPDYHERWIKANPEKAKVRKEYQRQYALNKARQAKVEVFNHYGRECECCGEENQEFLAIDHINGGGHKHRQEIGKRAGSSFYIWLVRKNFPSGFRTLCHNCNMSLGFYGYCPHQTNT